MRSRVGSAVLVAVCALLLSGCAGDVTQQLASSPEMQADVMNTIAGNPDLASQMLDKLLASDQARALLHEKLMADGETMQIMMSEFAKDRTRVEGILNLAVQDSAMRDHVMTLFKGMEMAKRGR